MVSPLFRTLSIASLRYRHEDVEVVKTQAFESLELVFEDRNFDCELGDKAIEIDLQVFDFDIELQKDIELDVEESDHELH